MSDPFGYLFVFGAGPYRAYVYPMRRFDGPYRVELTAETGAGSSFYGLPSAERCVENVATFLRSQGIQIPAAVIAGWYAEAAKFDQAPEVEKTGDWS